MGQTLSEPVVEKHTSVGEDDTLVYAISEMQGWRISMEDAHATVLNLDGKTGDEKASFFAVYDGHGGSEAGKFAAKTLHDHMATLKDYKEGRYQAALKQAFLDTDSNFFASKDGDPSGCTAVAALLVAGPAGPESQQEKTARQIIVANAGDSRCVLGLKGEAKPLSFDHKPGNKDENARIVAAGGFVEFGRVNGNLALSRAIGDCEFKRNDHLSPEAQIVTADPEIITHDVTGEEEFLVLACDGIWDCLSSQQVIDFVRRQIAKGVELKDICEEAMDRCCAPDSEIGGVGCDNMTMCVIALLNGRTKEEWYQWVKQRVEEKVGWDTPADIAPVFNTPPQQPGGNKAVGQGGQGGFGGNSVLQALAGGLAGVGGQAQAGSQQDGAGPAGGFRLAPGGLAAALGGMGSGRFVLRPGEPDEKGEPTYEAHVVDEDDDDSEDDDEDVEEATAAAGTSSDTSAPKPSKITSLNEASIAADEKLSATSATQTANKSSQSSSSSSTDDATTRPGLEHQPEVVESTSAKTDFTEGSSKLAGGEDKPKVDVRPSTEGTGSGGI